MVFSSSSIRFLQKYSAPRGSEKVFMHNYSVESEGFEVG